MTSFNTAFPTTKPLVIHYPRFALPAEHDGLPLVGMVRNPWDWYVSWYAFNRQPYVFDMLFEVLSDGGHSDFKTTVTSLVNLGSDDIESRHYRNVLISVFPETLEGNRGVGLTKDCIRGFSDNETGYCSWLFERMHGDVEQTDLYVGRFENLERDFLDIMEQLSVAEHDAIKNEFTRTDRKNSSRHDHYSRYYDD